MSNHLLCDGLLKEYEVCAQRVQSLDKNIWQTAAIFGIGSVTAISYLLSKDISVNFLLVIFYSAMAIGAILVWKRLSKRWWSLQHSLLIRMEHIERLTNLRSNLFTKWQDQIKMKKKGHCLNIETIIEFSEIEEDNSIDTPFLTFQKEIINYEFRGIQPIIDFLIYLLISSWSIIGIFYLLKWSLPDNKQLIDNIQFAFLLSYLFLCFILYQLKVNNP